MKKISFLIAGFLVLGACEKAPAESKVKGLLDGGALVVDVRTPGEFASGHHPRAINIPVDQVESRIADFGDKNKPVVVYCASGSRSGRAKRTLEAAGFSSVTNAGGYRDLP
jgi:phage shock protein E